MDLSKCKVRGTQIKFWEGIWLGEKPSIEVYPNLYRLVKRKDDTMANVLQTIPLNVSFRRCLVNENLTSWYDLVSKVVPVNLTNGKDGFRWKLSKNGMFIVRSMYRTDTVTFSLRKKPILKIEGTTES